MMGPGIVGHHRGVSQSAAEQHRHFAGDRDAGRLGHHEDEYGKVPEPHHLIDDEVAEHGHVGEVLADRGEVRHRSSWSTRRKYLQRTAAAYQRGWPHREQGTLGFRGVFHSYPAAWPEPGASGRVGGMAYSGSRDFPRQTMK